MPEDNAAAIAIRSVGSVTARPDQDGLEQVAGWLAQLADRPAERERLGRRSREFAEREFDLDAIAGRFLKVLRRLPAGPGAVGVGRRGR
jgi:glycosyltransferase involved in cell wall biosynthesis